MLSLSLLPQLSIDIIMPEMGKGCQALSSHNSSFISDQRYPASPISLVHVPVPLLFTFSLTFDLSDPAPWAWPERGFVSVFPAVITWWARGKVPGIKSILGWFITTLLMLLLVLTRDPGYPADNHQDNLPLKRWITWFNPTIIGIMKQPIGVWSPPNELL